MHNFHTLRNPNFQLDKVHSIENGSLVTFMNNYMYSMVELLNNFAQSIQTRLIDLTHKIDICHTNLVILEMKLNSINPIQRDTNISSKIPTPIIDAEEENASSTAVDMGKSPPTTTTETETESTIDPDNSLKDSDNSSNDQLPENSTGENDQILEVYRRMIRFGIHENAVRQKMSMDGVDPSLLFQ